MTDLHVGRFSFFNVLRTMGVVGLGAALTMNVAAQTALANPTGVSLPTAPPGNPPESVTKVPTLSTSSSWGQLTPTQRQALAPLGAQWSALTTQQQAKWINLSKNFNKLTVEAQITMHSRMADWVDLSPQQRNLARLNFNQFQNLPSEDKKAKWEAYQALPKEEKRLLSAGTASPTKSAAPTIKPLEAHRQVQTPVKASASPHAAATIDRKTLLPRPPTWVTPAPITPAAPTTDLPEGLKSSSETAPS